jgi:hypothetical protein
MECAMRLWRLIRRTPAAAGRFARAWRWCFANKADRNVTALASDMLALSFLPLPSIRARVH